MRSVKAVLPSLSTARGWRPRRDIHAGIQSSAAIQGIGREFLHCGHYLVVPAPSDVDLHIAALNPAQLLQRLLERQDPSLTLWVVRDGAREHTDPPHLFGLLRTPHERPNSARSSNCFNEIASSHCLPKAGTTPRRKRLQQELATDGTGFVGSKLQGNNREPSMSALGHKQTFP